MATEFVYSVSSDTLNGKVDIDKLLLEIGQSAITVSLANLSRSADVLTINFNADLLAGEDTVLNGVVAAHDGVSLEEPLVEQPVKVNESPPFAAKKITVNGVEKSLFKRVHGVNGIILANSTGNIDFEVPYPHVKFTGANIFGSTLKDTLDFTVHDDATNTYSGAPGSNYQLNQFGFNVEMPGEQYENTSDYDADLYYGMIVRCSYTNNTNEDKYIAMNVWLHEVK